MQARYPFDALKLRIDVMNKSCMSHNDRYCAMITLERTNGPHCRLSVQQVRPTVSTVNDAGNRRPPRGLGRREGALDIRDTCNLGMSADVEPALHTLCSPKGPECWARSVWASVDNGAGRDAWMICVTIKACVGPGDPLSAHRHKVYV